MKPKPQSVYPAGFVPPSKQQASNLAKLPELCYGFNAAQSKFLTIIKRGETGFYLTDFPAGNDGKALAREMNQRMGVTDAQASAMLNGSMFGWHTKAADADHEINRRG